MNIKEFRIGNYIQICNEEGIWFPTVLTQEFWNPQVWGYGNSKPIDLNPEILQKCGFENRSQTSDYYFINGGFIVGGYRKTFYPSIHGESGLEAYGNELQYLHQLQNLYFALTNIELNFIP